MLHNLKPVFDAAYVEGDPNPRATLLQEVRDLLLKDLNYWKGQRQRDLKFQFDRLFNHAEPKSQLVYEPVSDGVQQQDPA